MTSVSPLETLRRQQTRSTHRIHSLPQLVLMRTAAATAVVDVRHLESERDEARAGREDIERQMGSLRNLHVQRIVLSGGEALMHKNLWLLCELLRELNKDLQITLL